jgi:hypothetical protein
VEVGTWVSIKIRLYISITYMMAPDPLIRVFRHPISARSSWSNSAWQGSVEEISRVAGWISSQEECKKARKLQKIRRRKAKTVSFLQGFKFTLKKMPKIGIFNRIMIARGLFYQTDKNSR